MQPLVSVSLSGFDALTQKVGSVTDLLEHLDPKHPVFTDALARIAQHVTKEVKQRTPVRTGALRDDIRGWVQPGEAIIESTKKHARFIEHGTKAHGPVSKPWLVFKGRDGKWVRTKWVRGIQPFRMFKGGVEASAQFISEALHQAVTLLFL